MADTMYYDENLFYINEVINTIFDGLKLDLDPRLCAEKIMEDILFVENALSTLSGSLLENELMINRNEHLRRLVRTMQRFADVLETIPSGNAAVARDLSDFHAKYRDSARVLREQLKPIFDELSVPTSASINHPDVVSEQEFRFLLDTEHSEEPA